MRNAILLGPICLWASMLLADGNVKPLNVKTGLWQVTSTHTLNGQLPITPEMQARLDAMKPEQRARFEQMMKARTGGTPHMVNYKTCVTAKDLQTNAFANGPDEKCTWNVKTSTGTDMDVLGSSCEAGRKEGMNTDVEVKLHVIDSEHVGALTQGTASGNGRTINFNGSYKGNWVSASCPGNKD